MNKSRIMASELYACHTNSDLMVNMLVAHFSLIYPGLKNRSTFCVEPFMAYHKGNIQLPQRPVGSMRKNTYT